MKKVILFAILSLAAAGCTNKVSDIADPNLRDEIVIDKETPESGNQNENQNSEPEIAPTSTDKNIQETENWRVYEKKDQNVRIKYHKNWYYDRDEQAEKELGYYLYVGFAESENVLEQGRPYPIEFMIWSSNVGVWDGDPCEYKILKEQNDKKYILKVCLLDKYGDILDKMAESFEFLDEINIEKESLGGAYFKDQKFIYYKEYTIEDKYKYEIIENADIDTFKIIISNFRSDIAKDKNFVYWREQKIKDADPSTFKFLIHSYSKDKDNAYRGNNKIQGIDAETFEIISCDVGDERSDYLKDKNNIYKALFFNEDGIWERNKIVKNADPETFEYFPERHNLTDGPGCSYAKDKNSVYLNDERLDGANPDYFKLLIKEGIYGKDNNFVYWESKKIIGADIETFETLDWHYSKDKNYVYKDGKIIEGEDPKIFNLNK